MAGRKTLDGIRLARIEKVCLRAGAEARAGSNHRIVLSYPGLKNCPLATSTHARRMVAPWYAKIKKCTPREAYRALASG